MRKKLSRLLTTGARGSWSSSTPFTAVAIALPLLMPAAALLLMRLLPLLLQLLPLLVLHSMEGSSSKLGGWHCSSS